MLHGQIILIRQKTSSRLVVQLPVPESWTTDNDIFITNIVDYIQSNYIGWQLVEASWENVAYGT